MNGQQLRQRLNYLKGLGRKACNGRKFRIKKDFLDQMEKLKFDVRFIYEVMDGVAPNKERQKTFLKIAFEYLEKFPRK